MTRTKRILLHITVTIVLIALGIFGFRVLKASKPLLKKRRPPAALTAVRTIKIKTGPQSIIIRGEGIVGPLREINLASQVGGKVVYASPALVNGGEFRKGDNLLRIEPVDYQLAVTLAEAKVKDAESKLELARVETEAAREEWRLLHPGDPKGNKKPPPLVVREPQLAAAQARLKAERANLRKAYLDLERTEIRAPFDGRVSQENVDTGQYILSGQALATIYSIEAAEIVLPLEDEDLHWFHAPGFTKGDGPGSSAKVRVRIAGEELTWPGEVVRTEGKLDERTRMINVIVQVNNPYSTKPPLAVGLFVTVNIKGRTLPYVAIIPRPALREEEVVWVVDKDGLLHFQKVDIARIQGERILVRSGLKDGEMVVISSLKAVTNGMAVRNIMVTEGEDS